MDSDTVCKELGALNTKKATCFDGISSKLLKAAAPVIAEPLTKIFNLSIATGIMPYLWKTAKVTATHKGGSLQDLNNYRPISILPVLSKLVERHVHKHFYAYLTQHNLLHAAQSGFRSKHSLETAKCAKGP